MHLHAVNSALISAKTCDVINRCPSEKMHSLYFQSLTWNIPTKEIEEEGKISLRNVKAICWTTAAASQLWHPKSRFNSKIMTCYDADIHTTHIQTRKQRETDRQRDRERQMHRYTLTHLERKRDRQTYTHHIYRHTRIQRERERERERQTDRHTLYTHTTCTLTHRHTHTHMHTSSVIIGMLMNVKLFQQTTWCQFHQR